MDIINVDDMTEQQLEETMVVVGNQVNEVLIEAKQKVNDMVNKYGLYIELSFEIKLIE